jgi:hypothetical protein
MHPPPPPPKLHITLAPVCLYQLLEAPWMGGNVGIGVYIKGGRR